MFKLGDRVKLSDRCIEDQINMFGDAFLKESGVDMRGFGEGVIVGFRDVIDEVSKTKCGDMAVIEWENPQTLIYNETDTLPNETDTLPRDKLLNEINLLWLEKIE